MTTFTTKTNALKIARHLHGQVHRVAANGNSVTWGYTSACGPREITTSNCGNRAEAVMYRRESIAQMVDTLVNGVGDEWALPDAPKVSGPDWMSLDFKW